jgi:UDP-glucuronate decarboxylase
MHPNDGRVVSNFIVQALKGEDITVYGDGNQTRSFCFVDDLVDGMIKFMNLPKENTGPMNLGNPTEFTILDLAKKVIELTKSKSRIVMHKLPQDDPRQRKPDITYASELIDWSPKTDLNSGLKQTIAYFSSLSG